MKEQKKYPGVRTRGTDPTKHWITLNLGYEVVDGKKKKKQDFIPFEGTAREAFDRRAELQQEIKNKTFVRPSKLTTIEVVRASTAAIDVRLSTQERYEDAINLLAKTTLADMLIQDVRASHIETCFKEIDRSAESKLVVLTVLRQTFRVAARDRLIVANVVLDIEKNKKPKRPRNLNADAQKHCHTAEEMKAYLAYVKAHETIQLQALSAVAYDLGLRKNELCGLQWPDIHFETNEIDITKQLLRTYDKTQPVETWFGPTKSGKSRTLKASHATMRLVKLHKQSQAEFKMAHRVLYHDCDLVFANELGDLRTRCNQFGYPLERKSLSTRFTRLCKAAGVRRIKFHGTRHTCATLLLRAGQEIHVVSQRLGHADVATTYKYYAHVLPDQQQAAADAMGALLHG